MRIILAGLALAFICASGSVAGQEAGASCAAIASDADRLACYDRLFRDGVPAVPSDAIVIESESLIPAQPSGRQRATFSLACEAGSVGVTFAFAGQQMSATGDIAPLTLQVDQGATAVRTMAAAPDNRSLSFSTARDVTGFLDSLAGGTNLRVRVTPVRLRSLTVIFRLPEHIEAITRLRETCN